MKKKTKITLGDKEVRFMGGKKPCKVGGVSGYFSPGVFPTRNEILKWMKHGNRFKLDVDLNANYKLVVYLGAAGLSAWTEEQ